MKYETLDITMGKFESNGREKGPFLNKENKSKKHIMHHNQKKRYDEQTTAYKTHHMWLKKEQYELKQKRDTLNMCH